MKNAKLETKVDYDLPDKKHVLADRLIPTTTETKGLSHALVLECRHNLTPESAVKGDNIEYVLSAYRTIDDQGMLFPHFTTGVVRAKLNGQEFPLTISRSDEYALQGFIPALTYIESLEQFIGYVHGYNQMEILRKMTSEKTVK